MKASELIPFQHIVELADGRLYLVATNGQLIGKSGYEQLSSYNEDLSFCREKATPEVLKSANLFDIVKVHPCELNLFSLDDFKEQVLRNFEKIGIDATTISETATRGLTPNAPTKK